MVQGIALYHPYYPEKMISQFLSTFIGYSYVGAKLYGTIHLSGALYFPVSYDAGKFFHHYFI
jgi:hypothetical protein